MAAYLVSPNFARHEDTLRTALPDNNHARIQLITILSYVNSIYLLPAGQAFFSGMIVSRLSMMLFFFALRHKKQMYTGAIRARSPPEASKPACP